MHKLGEKEGRMRIQSQRRMGKKIMMREVEEWVSSVARSKLRVEKMRPVKLYSHLFQKQLYQALWTVNNFL